MKEKKKQKGFFAIDIDQCKKVRDHQLGLEEMSTYLALLKSTDQSNVTSSGGVRSVVEYTGLSRAEVKQAIGRLSGAGLIECLDVANPRARTVPRYNLPANEPRSPLGGKEKLVFQALRNGKQPSGKTEDQAARRAARKGWLESCSDGWRIIEHANNVAFIPNTFVSMEDGRSPLSRLVNNGELEPLLLAVELYQLQNLNDDNGVSPKHVRDYYKPESKETVSTYCIHELSNGRKILDEDGDVTNSFTAAYHRDWWSGGDFWRNLKALDAAHVTERAIYSANGRPDLEQSEFDYKRPQRPLGVIRNGRQVLNTPEFRPAFASFLLSELSRNGGSLNSPIQDLIEKWCTQSPLIAVENSSVSHVEAVGIVRLVQRPANDNTKSWWRELCLSCEQSFFFRGKCNSVELSRSLWYN